MKRNWQGVLVIEGEQTGDGRFIVPGAIEWSELPLPLGWLMEEMHGMLLTGGVQVGTIESIERVGDEIRATGTIDDETEEGAEQIRRMESGTAAHGEQAYVSIDPDDSEVEIVATDAEEVDEVVLIASGQGVPPNFHRTLTAAAGEGDPEDEGTVLFEDSADTIIERYTRLRIRGATICAIPAFDRAIISLSDAGSEAPAEETEAVAASASRRAVVAGGPLTPPAEWFEDPKLTEPTPVTITDDGRVFGHVAQWGVCHTGIQDQCVIAPHSQSGYAHFLTGGFVHTAEGTRIRVGHLTMDAGHAPLHLDADAARRHYDNSATSWANVVAGEDAHGAWIAGAVLPDVSDEQVVRARSLALSGDWRTRDGHLELHAALSVPVPGFPVAASLVASATPLTPRVYMHDGQPLALVAAGVVSDCGCVDDEDPAVLRRDLDELTSLVYSIDKRTKPLRASAARSLRDRIAR